MLEARKPTEHYRCRVDAECRADGDGVASVAGASCTDTNVHSRRRDAGGFKNLEFPSTPPLNLCSKLATVFSREEEAAPPLLPIEPVPGDDQGVRRLDVSQTDPCG